MLLKFFDNKMYDLNDSFSGNNDQNKMLLPELTRVKHLCSCCFLDFNYVPAIKRIFINSWQVSIFMPLLVLSIITSSYYVYIHFCLKLLTFLNIYITIILTFFMVLFIVSYLVAIIEGPGYLPFYYPFRLDDESDKYRLSGIVSTREQLAFVEENKNQELRMRYFKSSKRYVIRPDHFCDWFASFIGKKNHKLFFLFNVYGAIYIGAFLVFDFMALLKAPQKQKGTAAFPVLLIYSILALVFFSFTLSMFLQSIPEISSNETTYEIMRRKRYHINIHRHETSKLEGWEDICGPSKYWYMWILPIPAFCGIDEYDLIHQHSSNTIEKLL